MNKKIFISIASYRDPELIPTIRDCLQKAKHKANLIFSIVWQHNPNDEWDNLDEFKNNPNFHIQDINYKNSQGTCWARSLAQQPYNNETYYLQLDSHHRFIQDWDEVLIEMLESLKSNGNQKPIITGYPPSYDPANPEEEISDIPSYMKFLQFEAEIIPTFNPSIIDNHKELTHPLNARFISAGFIFTIGQFIKDIPYDPNYYFIGEEINLTLRAFTHGYKIFHPQKVILWHEYIRKNKPRHWEDNEEGKELNLKSTIRVKELLEKTNSSDLEPYGLGTIRTIQDYEKYAGINFKLRGVQKYTLENKYPPNPTYQSLEEYEKSFIIPYKLSFNINKKDLAADISFVLVKFFDNDNNQVFSKDIYEHSYNEYLKKAGDNDDVNITIEVFTENEIRKIEFLPYSNQNKWYNSIEIILEPNNYVST